MNYSTPYCPRCDGFHKSEECPPAITVAPISLSDPDPYTGETYDPKTGTRRTA